MDTANPATVVAGHRKRLKRYNLPGHAHFLTFSVYRRLPLLTNDLWRAWLATEVRRACDCHEIALWAYVFMPEHVHLLVKPTRETYDIAVFLKDMKGEFSMRLAGHLAASGSALWERLRIRVRPGVVRFRFWQEGGGYDRNLWALPKVLEKAEYCHWNPVKRGLVQSPGQWPWSSYRWLEEGRREGEVLRVDEWDERLLDGRQGADER